VCSSDASVERQVIPGRAVFFPGVRGAIISWKAARELGILPTHYPMLIQVNRVAIQKTQVTGDGGLYIYCRKSYGWVFDGQVRVMKGEIFTITLQDDVVPCKDIVNSTLRISGQEEEGTKTTPAARYQHSSDRSYPVVCIN